jgi:uncharacterized protein
MRLRAGLMLMVALTCAPRARAQEPQTAVAQGPSIVTMGEATVRLAPDQAFVTLAVETRDNNPRTAQRQNADAMTSIQQRIAAAGIPRDAVRTTGYSIQQEFDFANGRRTPRGYVARNGVEVRVDALERVGELLDAMVAAGATTVSGVRFDVKDRASAEREALRLAVVDARARADAMATGAGRSVDRVLRITDSGQPRFKPVPQMMMMERAGAAAAETPVAPGEIEVHAQVELTTSLK